MTVAIREVEEINSTNSVGSSLEDFLREEGIYEECYDRAVKELFVMQLKAAMKEKGITKTEMARLMETSRSGLTRLLNPGSDAVTLQTLEKAAAAVGKRLVLSLD